ncbi:PREDICTED: uncharacterized protein LOC109580874 [Amphimedon queenslandica]|uniref:Uncharacterized protein n=1 Tax=Amphimedon queenslandica TaxID=400682 RepID=A0AAN0IZV2_AMPQE|nr:PREDICTED: uncharacterized protein LOC109580874 [Amphimedon queenslandica]|eukprot:XP_019849993.1 PREDICTED: uncharacterized protein LOC109580874 [Amphimedon queenslandica]
MHLAITPTPTIISIASSVITMTNSSTISYFTETTTMTTAMTNGGNTGVIVGLSVALIILLILAISIIIILVMIMHIKRTNINQKRKSDDDIVVECSPAYATPEFKTNTADDILMKDSPAYSTVQQTQSAIIIIII